MEYSKCICRTCIHDDGCVGDPSDDDYCLYYDRGEIYRIKQEKQFFETLKEMNT